MLKISCKCITNARVKTLEESIYSFLNQEYDGERELIIVNDCEFQELKFDHPDVKIFNIKNRFETLGEKENFTIDQCKYPIIAVWDDDDVALPNHLSNINKWFKDCDLLSWKKGALLHGSKISKITSVGQSGIVYTKKIWEDVGKHEKMSYGYDTAFIQKINKHKGRKVLADPDDSDVSWFYMWGGRSYHLSGIPKKENQDQALEIYRQHTLKQLNNGEIPSGIIELEPKWKVDYMEILKNYLHENDSSIGDA